MMASRSFSPSCDALRSPCSSSRLNSDLPCSPETVPFFVGPIFTMSFIDPGRSAARVKKRRLHVRYSRTGEM